MSVNDDDTSPPSKAPRKRRRRRAIAPPPPAVEYRRRLPDDVEELEVEQRDDGLHIGFVVRRPKGDNAAEQVGDAFVEEARRLLGGALPPVDVARRAARLATAEEAWSQRQGALFDARDVSALLEVSKQRVSALTRDGRLVALSASGRLRYPAWQFAGLDAAQRATVTAAHRLLVDVGGIDPWSAADWALHGHPDLGGEDAVAWLRDGGEADALLRAAERDAHRAAQ